MGEEAGRVESVFITDDAMVEEEENDKTFSTNLT